MKSTIFIPEPCHENWNQMSPTEKGRFCQVCTKEVVDFTHKSRPEILNHLKNASGNTCGQFSISQLNQPVIVQKKNPLKKWALSTLAMMGMLGWFKEGKAQLKGKVAVRGQVAFTESHNQKADTTVIYGSVTENYNNRPVAGAEVKIYSGEKLIAQAKTISNGSYRAAIAPGEIEMNSVSVMVEHIDFITKEISQFPISKKENKINIAMEEEIMMLGEVMYIPEEELIDSGITTGICSIDTIVSTSTENTPDTTVQLAEVPEKTRDSSMIENTIEIRNPVQSVTIFTGDPGFLPEIHPNPVTETTIIETGIVSAFTLRILDATGKLMGTQSFSGQRSLIEMTHYPAGIYFIEITDVTNGNKKVLRAVKP